MIPGCTYCSPQIASVGLTEQAAKEKRLDIRVGRFPFVGNGKAIALGEDQGLVKVIFDKKTGQLLGAHMVGAEVTELIQGFVVAMNLETTEEELMHTIFPHPTLSEMMKEACSTPMAASQYVGDYDGHHFLDHRRAFGRLACACRAGRGRGGILGNLAVGLIGAVVGGWLLGALGIISAPGFGPQLVSATIRRHRVSGDLARD